MTGELDRGYAEGINENDLQRRTARGEKINLVGTDVIKHNGDIHTSDGRYEPQRQEYLELIHLMNQKTKQILENGLEAMTQAEYEFMTFTVQANCAAQEAGLYKKRRH